MNNNLNIIKAIKDYMNNPLKYALLLDGTWGSGKTYFVQNELKDMNTTYISLNGVSSLNNIALQMIYQLLDNNYIENKNILSRLFKNKDNKIIGTVGSILVSHIESKVNISFSELIKLVGNIDFKDKLIIFDDLERCSLPLEETLGFINNLVEHNKIKVLIVANEQEINKNDEYLKIKEKLIYQTLKFVPDLEILYDSFIINKEYEEVINNKSFVIDELKRYNHLNIRTLQFIFQRYKELKEKIIDLIDKDVDKKIKKQILNDIFKYLVVVSRDYKLGKNIDDFEGEDLISNYQLIENSYFSITSFSFVNDFILGYEFSEKSVKLVLNKYIKELSSSTKNENSTLSILNRWWEEEDDEIEENLNLIINELKINKHPFDYYPKILLYLLRITNAGFSENYLKNGLKFMKNNIINSTECVSLGYGILDASLSENEIEGYNKIHDELVETIDKHNAEINQQSTCDVKKQQVGNMGEYLYRWCIDNKSLLLKEKKFLKFVDNRNIIYIIEHGNNKDIRYLVYLFNEIYNFANIKELYIKDDNCLEKLNELILNINTNKFNKMKKFSLNSLKEAINKYIKVLKN